MSLARRKRKTEFKKVVYDFIYSPFFEIVVIVAIISSVTLLIIDAATSFHFDDKAILYYMALSLDIFFVIEYASRILIAPSKWGFFKRHLIDFIALFPILRFFRLVRIIRIIRIAKIAPLRHWSNTFSTKSRSLGLELQQKKFEGSLVIFVLLAVVLIGSVGILMFEKGHNDHFQSFLDGFWWSTVTLTTVGYGDKFPVTLEGRILAIFIMFLGLSCFALITGFVSSFIIQRYKKEEYTGMDLVGLKRHIIICGWNSNASTVLKELSALYETELKQYVVIAEEQPDYSFLESVYFVKGDFTKRDTLDRAQIARAKSVIILADTTIDRTPQDIDARTILASLAVDCVSPEIYTCVEVLSPDNIDHVINAGIDEYIIAASYTGNLLAHSVRNPGISKVYQELLMSTVGNQIFRIDAPDEYLNRPFKECSIEFLNDELGILIGLERKHHYIINPDRESVNKGDTLVFIGRHELGT